MLRDLFRDGGRSLTELLDAAFRLYRLRFGKLVLISALFTIIALLFAFPGILAPESDIANILSFGGQIATFIAGIALLVYALGALADKELTIGQSVGGAMGRFWSYFGMGILVALAIGGIMLPATFISFAFFPLALLAIPITFAAIVFLAVRWIVGGVAVVAERAGPTEALGRSWGLTDGLFWRSAVYSILLGLLSFVFFYVPLLIVGFAAVFVPPEWAEIVRIGSSLAAYLFSIFWMPFNAIAMALYYYDLRVRKENLDLELRVQAIAEQNTNVAQPEAMQ